MMMTAEKFNTYSKADLYKIYCQLYQKLEEKDSLIAEHVVTVSEFLKKIGTGNNYFIYNKTNN